METLAASIQALAAEVVLVGTSSWKYPGWIGPVYDEGCCLTRGKLSEAKFHREPQRQSCFPVRQAEQPEWFSSFANKVTAPATACGIPADDITDIVKDAKYCGYTVGLWLTQARQLSPAATAALEDLYTGTTPGDFVLPTFVAPTLPTGVVPVPAGALDRIFAFAAILRQKAGYNETTEFRLMPAPP